MRPYEKKILEERLKDFMEEVIPGDLLPYLSCLQQTDKEAIEATQRNKGPTTANQTLVDRLKRRDKGFSEFVRALRKCGSEHTALLLDPYYNYPSKPLCSIRLYFNNPFCSHGYGFFRRLFWLYKSIVLIRRVTRLVIFVIEIYRSYLTYSYFTVYER